MPGEKFLSTQSITKIAICVAICVVTSYIAIPLPFTPAKITALTLAMNLTAFLLGWRETFVVLAVYMALGAVGLPVFGGSDTGLAKLLGPTGGFYLGFIVAYPLVSLLKGSAISFRRYALTAIIVGIPITYIGGVLGLMYSLNVDVYQALVMGVFPFILGDVLKSLAASYIGVRLKRRL